MGMRVLVTGATGFLGYRILESLSLNPAIGQLLATGRAIKPTHYITDPKVRYKLGDLADRDFVDSLMHGVDCVINAAALSSPWGAVAEFRIANVVTQANLIEAAKKNNVKRFIYISTPSIYFDGTHRFDIKESDPLPGKFVNSYAATKREAEMALIDSGIPHVILRPRALIGRGDTVIMPRIIKAFESGKLKIIGDGRNLVDLTSVDNLVRVIGSAIFVNEAALNEIYNISNGAPVLLWECIENVLTQLGYQFSQKKVPYWLVGMLAQLMEWKSAITDFKEPVLTVYGVGTLAKSFTMDISKARQLLNYQPTVTTDEAIKEFARWYAKNV